MASSMDWPGGIKAFLTVCGGHSKIIWARTPRSTQPRPVEDSRCSSSVPLTCPSLSEMRTGNCSGHRSSDGRLARRKERRTIRVGGGVGALGPWEDEWRQLWPQSLWHPQGCSLPRRPHPRFPPTPLSPVKAGEGLKLPGAPSPPSLVAGEAEQAGH